MIPSGHLTLDSLFFHSGIQLAEKSGYSMSSNAKVTAKGHKFALWPYSPASLHVAWLQPGESNHNPQDWPVYVPNPRPVLQLPALRAIQN